MTRHAFLIPLLALGACAVVNTAPPPEQVRQLRDARDSCLMHNAIRFDDGRSDAATVGRAVSASCSQQNNALIAAIAGPDGFREGEIRRQIEQNSQEAATQYVLSHRAARAVRR
jgi:hypothetical protein